VPSLALALAVLCLAAQDPAAPATGSAPAVPPAPSPAPPPIPSAAALLRSAVAVEPAQRIALVPGGEVVVDSGATFEIELSARLPDAVLALVDGRDDLVASTSSRELAAGTRLTLSPAAPLVPGSRYVLRIDGASQRDLHDEAGRAFAPLTLPILVAGSPPPPEPKKPARRKKRR
jgi:hypothetical protein